MASEFFKDLIFCKENIIKKSKSSHFDSQGFIGSFGNKGSYSKLNDDSSIDQYSNKQSKDPLKQEQIDDMAAKVEEICLVSVGL